MKDDDMRPPTPPGFPFPEDDGEKDPISQTGFIVPSGATHQPKPKVSARWGNNMEVTADVKCPSCGRTTSITAQNSRSGKVRCSCGNFTINVQGTGLRDAQRAADDIRRTFKNLFK